MKHSKSVGSYKVLICRHVVCKWGNDFLGEKVKCETKCNGKRKCREGTTKDGQEDESEAQPDQDGNEASLN